MKQTVNFRLLICLFLLSLLVGFNLYLHRVELSITNEVNDNTFQYALIDEAKVIWQYVLSGQLSPFYLFDSFNERWNEGFALSSYYSHLPQAVIALISLVTGLDAYKLFTLVKFLLLVFLPLPFFLMGRIVGLSALTSLLIAYFSHLTFTDGLYGIDISSFLWRGWGLSSQLVAIFIMPIAYAYSYTYLEKEKNLGKAILANFLFASSHSGIFLITVLSLPVLLLFHRGHYEQFLRRLGIFAGLTGISLAYFFVPFFTQSDFRNFSLWDPIWKFDSFGILPVVTWFLDGKLFDFGRPPVLTLLVLFGLFFCLISPTRWFRFTAVSFLLYSALFMGRSTFGPLIGLIPGLSEFHLHRFVVGLQFTGIIAASGLFTFLLQWVVDKIRLPKMATAIILVLLLFPIIYYLEKPIVKYSTDNASWIRASNKKFQLESPPVDKAVEKLKTLPDGRVYAGRPGNWGRNFKVGDEPVYMYLAQNGFKTVGLAPQSWSPNSEYDQFFGDSDKAIFDLYNVRHALFPDTVTAPQFAKKKERFGKFNLYEIDTDGWFTTGISRLVVTGKKTDFVNITHLWLNSPMFKARHYPTILFQGDKRDFKYKYYYTMLDLNNFRDNNGNLYTLWQRNPTALNFGISNLSDVKKLSESSSFQKYRAEFKVEKDCPQCIVILKQTFHPNWQVKVNGRDVSAYPVFPFYIGIPIEKVGKYHVEAVYRPNNLKVLLIVLGLMAIGGLSLVILKNAQSLK